jgi:phosphatidylserine/phosphatidylglycerophosphate/cardiolipin synthase-like enzyme
MPDLWWFGRLLAVAVTALVAGCQPLAGAGFAASPAPSAPLLSPAPAVRVGADEITLLRSGAPTFAALRSLIDGARTSVHVEVYEFGRQDLIQAVETARQRGVAVTVINDPSEISSAATTIQLRSQGVDVVD